MDRDEVAPDLDASDDVVSFDAFVDHLCRELELEHSTVSASSRFVEDLGFDSIRMLELSIVIEDLGVELDDSDLESLSSPERAFRAYAKQAQVKFIR